MGMNFFQKIALPLRLQESPFAVFNTWHYDPTAGEKRDFRLDFLRGIAIIFMVVNHLESHSYFNNITQGHIYASAAEGFVFLSGYVLGMVTLKRIDREGLKSAMRKLLERSRVLYLTSFTLMVSLGLLSIIAPGMTRPSFEQAPGSWWQIILAAATFHLAPPVIDILQLYVLLLLVSPGIFWLLRRGLWLPTLTISWSLWAIQQAHPYSFSLHPLDREFPYFIFATWQLLYVNGLFLGYYRKTVGKVWQKIPKLPFVLAMTTLVMASIWAAQQDIQLGVWPTNVSDRALWLRFTDRSINGPIRLVNLFALFSLMFAIVDACWQPLYKSLGKLLVPLGQNSLYVYILHVPVTVIWFLIPGLVQGSGWLTTLLQAMVIAGFWLMIKYQVWFNIVPR
jgi:hypothetical protein